MHRSFRRHHSLRRRTFLLVGLLAWAGPLAPAAAVEVTFRLVAGDAHEGGEGRAAEHLEEGTAFLYRAGGSVLERAVPLGRPVELPAGSWRWIGETAGRVTPRRGELEIGDGSDAGVLEAVLPAVPACRVDLDGGETWRGIRRLELLSIVTGTLYPVDPERRCGDFPPTRSCNTT